jgi:hypothetical protein
VQVRTCAERAIKTFVYDGGNAARRDPARGSREEAGWLYPGGCRVSLRDRASLSLQDETCFLPPREDSWPDTDGYPGQHGGCVAASPEDNGSQNLPVRSHTVVRVILFLKEPRRAYKAWSERASPTRSARRILL